MDIPEMLTVKETATAAKCTTRHIYSLMERRLIPEPQRFGDLVRFEKDKIVRWLRGDWMPDPDVAKAVEAQRIARNLRLQTAQAAARERASEQVARRGRRRHTER